MRYPAVLLLALPFLPLHVGLQEASGAGVPADPSGMYDVVDDQGGVVGGVIISQADGPFPFTYESDTDAGHILPNPLGAGFVWGSGLRDGLSGEICWDPNKGMWAWKTLVSDPPRPKVWLRPFGMPRSPKLR